MALGFIKKVFTFGKEKPADATPPTDETALTDAEKAAIAAETEPTDRVEDLPLADDPVSDAEMDTAGGPAAHGNA